MRNLWRTLTLGRYRLMLGPSVRGRILLLVRDGGIIWVWRITWRAPR